MVPRIIRLTLPVRACPSHPPSTQLFFSQQVTLHQSAPRGQISSTSFALAFEHSIIFLKQLVMRCGTASLLLAKSKSTLECVHQALIHSRPHKTDDRALGGQLDLRVQGLEVACSFTCSPSWRCTSSRTSTSTRPVSTRPLQQRSLSRDAGTQLFCKRKSWVDDSVQHDHEHGEQLSKSNHKRRTNGLYDDSCDRSSTSRLHRRRCFSSS